MYVEYELFIITHELPNVCCTARTLEVRGYKLLADPTPLALFLLSKCCL